MLEHIFSFKNLHSILTPIRAGGGGSAVDFSDALLKSSVFDLHFSINS